MTTEIPGVLEIDHNRGVIYFHCDPESVEKYGMVTVLRICGLGRIPRDAALDITVRPNEPAMLGISSGINVKELDVALLGDGVEAKPGMEVWVYDGEKIKHNRIKEVVGIRKVTYMDQDPDGYEGAKIDCCFSTLAAAEDAMLIHKMEDEGCERGYDESALVMGQKTYTYRQIVNHMRAKTEFGKEMLRSLRNIQKELAVKKELTTGGKGP